MLKLVTICLGTAFLMYLSGLYYPSAAQRTGRIGCAPKQGTDIFMAVAIFWLTCFMFLRTSYNDTVHYIYGWNVSESTDIFLSSGGLLDYTGNPLSNLWRTVSHDLSSSYHVYFLLPAILACVAAISLFKKYSTTPALSILIFLSIGTYVMYMAALKQCFATFFLILAIPCAEKKQYLRFYLLVAIAILFHTHAFLFAIVPLLLEKPWGKTTWIGLAIMLFMMATYDVTLGRFMEFAQSIGALVDEGELFDGHQIHVLRVVVYWIPAILALVFRNRLFQNSSRMENLFVNMSIVSAFILTLGLVQAANLFARMAGYFEIATAIAMPWMIRKLFTKRSAQLVTGIACVCYLGYFLYEFGVSKDFGSSYSAITLWDFFMELFGN